MQKDTTKVVYLIDDDSDDKMILIEAIQQINPGIKLEVFENGRDFMMHLEMDKHAKTPSLIILDYNMPYYTGAEVLKKLNDQGWLVEIPKVVWSTAFDYITKEECMSNGARNYYEKPNSYSGYYQLATHMLCYII